MRIEKGSSEYQLVPESDLDRMILRQVVAAKVAELPGFVAEWDDAGRFAASWMLPSASPVDLLDQPMARVEGMIVLLSGAMGPEAAFDWSAATIGVRVRPVGMGDDIDLAGNGWWMEPVAVGRRMAGAGR